MNMKRALTVLKLLTLGIVLVAFGIASGVSTVNAGSTGGSKISTSTSKPTTTSTSSTTTNTDQPKSGDYGKTVGDFPTKDINNGGTATATAGGNAKIIQRLDKVGNTISKMGSHKANRNDAIEAAAKDMMNEAARAPKNVANLLTGKNGSDKQLIKNVEGGLEQAGKNAQGVIDQTDQALIGFNQGVDKAVDELTGGPNAYVTPSAPSIYNQLKPGLKDLDAEAGRAAKNVKKNTDRALSDIQGEAGRASENVANFLTGKNDSDEQIIKNISGGIQKIEQVGDEFRNPITRTGEQIKRSGQDIANEAGRAWKNVPATAGQAVKDIQAEAGRAQQNIADVLSGKNMSDKQALNTISGGLAKFNKAADDALCRQQDCHIASPMTANDVYKAAAKAGKDVKAEINRGITKIGTGKKLGRDISSAADKAGDDISRAATTAAHQAGDAASQAANAATNAADQAGDAANDAADAVADAVGW